MATYYVDAKNGTDSAGTSGNTSNPWKSVSYAHSRASANDTIRLRGSQTDSTTFYRGAANILTVSKAGLTFEADSGHKPTFDLGWHRGLLRPYDPSKPYTHKSRYDYVMPSVTTGKFQNGQQAYTVVGSNSKFANLIFVQSSAAGTTFDGITFQNIDRNVFQIEGHRGTIKNCNFFWFFRQAAIFKNCSGGKIDSCRFIHGSIQVTPWDNATSDPNAFLNFYPSNYSASNLTPGGYTGEFTNNYVALMHGDGLIIQRSVANSGAPFLVEGNVIHDTEGFYPVSAAHVIFRRNVMFNTPNGNGLKFKTATKHSAYLTKDEGETISNGGQPSANIYVYANLFINTSGPAAIAMRFNHWTSGSPNHANHYFGFNSVFLPTGDPLFIATFHNLSGAKVGPVVVENNLFHGTGWGATPSSNAGGGTKVDTVYRKNALLATKSGFSDSVIASSAAMKIVAPTVIPQCVNACTYNPVIVSGAERFLNYADLIFRDNYGVPFRTCTNIDLRNYAPQSDSPVVNAARPRSPTTYAGANTGNTLTIPADAYDRDLWSTSTGPRADIGCFEYGSTPGGGGATNTVTADFTATPLSGLNPLTVAFTDASSHVGSYAITARLWNFGDGETSTATNPTHTYTAAGTYTPTLTVSANSGALTDIKVGESIIVLDAPPPPPPPPPPPDEEPLGSEAYVAVCTGTMPTSNTTMTLSGDLHGITPKAVELYVAGVTADDTPAAGNIFGVGMTDGTTHFAAAIHAVDNVSPTVARRRWTTGKALLLIKSDGAVMASATFNAFEADGVVLDVTWEAGVTPTAYKVTGLIHGGTDCRAKVSIVALGNAGTSVTVSPGFAPQIIKVAATFGAADTANNEAIISLGVAGSSGNQYALSRRVRTGTNTADTSAQLLAQVATLRFATGERGNAVAQDWTTTGVTIAVTDFDDIGSSCGVLLLSYGALRSSVTTLISPASPGTASVSLGWMPQVVQHLLCIIGAVGTSFATGTRTSTVGVHLRDASGGYSVQSLSQDDVNPSNENVTRDTAFSVRNGAASAVVTGATSLTATGYEIELSAVDSITLAFPSVVVEAAAAIEETPELSASFEMYGDNPGDAPLRMKFEDTSTGTHPVVAWLWDFGDGGTSTQRKPDHVYEAGGIFTVALTIWDAYGTTDTITVQDFLVVNGEPLAEGDELIIGPLVPLADIGASLTHETRVNHLAGMTNEGTIQFRLNIEESLEFSNGWAIVVGEDGVLRIRKDDGSLWDFDLTAV